MGQLIEVIELNVGRNLQYIRFSGTVIGGLGGWLFTPLQRSSRRFRKRP